MTNPTPRPALRKAEDAGLHPAAPTPARSPRRAAAGTAAAGAAAPAPEPAKRTPRAAQPAPSAGVVDGDPGKAGKAGKRARREFAGTTSDHLRPADAPTAAHDELHGKPAGRKAKGGKDPLMSGGTGKLEVTVPKKLRKAAAKEAAARGLDLDAVVADLLHAWLTGRR